MTQFRRLHEKIAALALVTKVVTKMLISYTIVILAVSVSDWSILGRMCTKFLATQLWCKVRASVLNWQCVLHETAARLLITSARREFSFGPIFFWLHTDMGCGQKKGLTLSVHRESRSVWLQTFYDTNGGSYRRRKPTDLQDRLWVFF